MAKKILSLLLAMAMVFSIGCVCVSAAENAAEVNGVEYATLAEAVAAVPANNTQTTVKLLRSVTDVGIKVKANQNIIFDFNRCTYTVNYPIGSEGTETLGFQLAKGSTVKMMNGTIESSAHPKLKVMIQNYADLTLENMTISAVESKTTADFMYALSNNCGKVDIIGSTKIDTNKTAIEASYWPSFYPDGTQITINTSEYGYVNGDIELGIYGKKGSIASTTSTTTLVINNANHKKGSLKLTAGEGSYATGLSQKEINNMFAQMLTINGGKFAFDPSAYVAEGYEAVPAEGIYTIGVATPKVYDNETAILTLKGKFAANGVDGAILAKNGAKLTINGTSATVVKALLGKDPSNGKNYSMAVWAKDAGTEVVINGGYFENEGDPDYESQADLIYAKENASITINGGTFKCATPRWTLNCSNGSGSVITVKGGKFYQFDPANAQTDGVNEIVVPEGYTVVKEGDWYKVVKEEAKVEFDSVASAIDEDGKGAIRFVFNATLPETTETYFGAYMLPLSVFTKSGVANAVRVQYAKTEVDASTSFSADLVKIPSGFFTTSIYAIPYIKTANGIATFAGASASVNSAQ